jgi:branched-chain amino acid transport system ATP-binding protein
MVAVGRGLMSGAKLLLVDEASMGMAPRVRTQMFDMLVEQCRAANLTLLVAEQDVDAALRIAGYVYIVQNGRIVGEGAKDHLSRGDVQSAYFGHKRPSS